MRIGDFPWYSWNLTSIAQGWIDDFSWCSQSLVCMAQGWMADLIWCSQSLTSMVPDWMSSFTCCSQNLVSMAQGQVHELMLYILNYSTRPDWVTQHHSYWQGRKNGGKKIVILNFEEDMGNLFVSLENQHSKS